MLEDEQTGQVDKPSHTLVSDRLESVASPQETHSRVRSSISRRITRPALAMAYRRDSEGYYIHPVLSPSHPRSRAGSDLVSGPPPEMTGATRELGLLTSRSLVEDPFYRRRNLPLNGIHYREPYETMPSHIEVLISYVRRDRDSPRPSLDELKRDKELQSLPSGAIESDIEQYFRTHVFPYPTKLELLQRSDRVPMIRQTIPNKVSNANLRVSNPVPDILYGYNSSMVLTGQQASEMDGPANHAGLVYPFFLVELEADGPSGCGSLWVATNQCLGASASCVNLAEALNRQLRHYDKVPQMENAVFSVAMSGSEARLYITWGDGEDYFMQQVDCFLLQQPQQYLDFRNYVRNIIDWGREKRLGGVWDCLDILLDEDRIQMRRASEPMRARPPPSDTTVNDSAVCTKRRK
ncbi:hypothetical protein CDD83_6205 [Cordyceps sp. RAO-2017]|nr:hypothetical protein CDD83_6205 [Cordyceps sp. RAO-2017]